MPTYAQLAAEPVWGAQYVPASLTDLLIAPLRAFYGLGPAAVGAPGDNNHLYGRHRSANWDRTSVYCTNRSYGTTDARDKRGDQNIYRAVDVGIRGQVLHDACRRLDALVRSGGAPGVAEWFGTFDGVNVVGWYEGHPSSSDGSHLWHLHVGFWNESANDPTTLTAVYNAITGEDEMTAQEVWEYPVTTTLEDGTAQTVTAGGWLTGANINAFHALAILRDVVVPSLARVEELLGNTAGGGSGAGPTLEEIEDAAFRGAQRAEDE